MDRGAALGTHAAMGREGGARPNVLIYLRLRLRGEPDQWLTPSAGPPAGTVKTTDFAPC